MALRFGVKLSLLKLINRGVLIRSEGSEKIKKLINVPLSIKHPRVNICFLLWSSYLHGQNLLSLSIAVFVAVFSF